MKFVVVVMMIKTIKGFHL